MTPRFAGLLLAAAACHRSPGPASAPADAGAVDVASALALDAAPNAAGVRPSRCHAVGQAIALGGAPPRGLEMGDAIATGAGTFSVAAAYDSRQGRVAGILATNVPRASAQTVLLGPTLGDAPPPRLASCGGRLLAAAYQPPGDARSDATAAGSSTRLDLFVITGASAHVAQSIPQTQGESFVSDLACSGHTGDMWFLVWEGSVAVGPAGAPPRGIIRAAAGTLGSATAPAPRNLSPADTDADAPRVVRRGDAGFFVLWVAHRPEASAPSGAPQAEISGEAPSYGWLEMVAVDALGNATGPVQRLTGTSGHISAYDVASVADDADPTGQAVLVIARDDGDADGSGGALLRLRARADHVEPAASLPQEGLGRGAPAIVGGAGGAWATWVGPREELHLVPLDAAGTPVAAPSTEDALDDARPLVTFPPDDHVLVATPADADGPLRVFACAR